MPKKWILCLCTPIFTLLMVINGGWAYAGNYTVEWWHMQKRTYENGKVFNRLGFAITDEFGNWVSTNVVSSIRLAGPGGTVSPDVEFTGTYETLFGRFNENSGQWEYDFDFKQENYWKSKIPGNLAAGNYTLTVIDTDDVPMANDHPTRYFHGVVDLPAISAKSFRGREDAGGNLLWQWDTPADMALWSQALDVSIRCWVSIYRGDDYVSDIYVRVPAMLGGLFVPNWVMDLARLKGDNFRVGLHIRTNDNNNRYYTNEIKLSNLKEERDTKKIVIPLL